MINENQEICKRIAEEIESYCENKMKRCPQCEKKIEWDDAQYNPHNGEYTCPICGGKFDESELETLIRLTEQFQIILMGEMIALQALRTVKKFDMKVADRLYIGLIKDLHHMGEIDYIVSDGYDVAQTAICFLYQYVDHSVHEIYGKDRKGKEITIKLACYREVDHFINLLRNRPDRRGTVVESIDFTDYKALPMDPVNCFEQEQTDYSKYDELVGALQLSALELAILNCYMNGMRQAEVCAELGIGRGKINSRKASIRQRYYNLYGAL